MMEIEKVFCNLAVEYYFSGYSGEEAITKAFKLLEKERGKSNE